MAEIRVESEITGAVWKVLVKPGDQVGEGTELVIMESMKMEIPIVSPVQAIVREVLVTEGQAIMEGTVVAVLDRA